MQNYYYFYTSFTSLALVVHIIVNWHQLANWRNLKVRSGALEYRIFLLCLLAEFVVDVMWGIFAEFKLPSLLYADTVFYFIMVAVSLFAWTRFVIVYLDMSRWVRGSLIFMGRSVLAFFIIVLLVNGFNECLFGVDSNGEYYTGPLRDLAHAILIGFSAIGSGLGLFEFIRSEGDNRRHNKMVFIFGITMLAAITLQYSNAFLPYFSLGCLLGCCLLHVFLVEEVRDEVHQKEMLARDYESQLDSERKAAQALDRIRCALRLSVVVVSV